MRMANFVRSGSARKSVRTKFNASGHEAKKRPSQKPEGGQRNALAVYEMLRDGSRRAGGLRRVLLQPRDRHRPRLLGRFHVRAVVARLRAQEPVRGAVEDVR